ncbi:hypothetical protein Ae201684_014526 [Aphanomyces euteiches]|uniref:Uncharacterized protein n=1 Tax=Aphanomyces euteiches TaxID=100861 RepID=A0A6G0WJJ4_9STRA|nr:hypothetical protein Ae201684_014526 [Aphanomyces euteiches]
MLYEALEDIKSLQTWQQDEISQGVSKDNSKLNDLTWEDGGFMHLGTFKKDQYGHPNVMRYPKRSSSFDAT